MGEVIVDGMSLMQYDAMALGPYELSIGPVVLRQRIQEAAFPILSANVLDRSSGELVAEPYAILQVGDHRVAVVGLTRLPKETLVKFEVLDPEQVLPQVITEVEGLADVVILLTNVSFRSAQELVQGMASIDLLVAALPEQFPDRAVRLSNPGTLAVTAEQPVPRHTGRWVGKLVAVLASDGTLRNESWTTVPMGPEIADDPEMALLLDRYQ